MSKISNFLNSQIGLLLVGFGLTTLLGTFFTDRIQEKSKEKEFALEKERQEASWQREKKYEIIRRKLDDGDKLIEQLSELINSRFYQLQNIYVNISSGNIKAAKENWMSYLKTVQDWNIRIPLYQNKVKRLISYTEANKLNNYETDNPELTNPKSIHGKFYNLHRKMLNYLTTATKGDRKETEKVQLEVSKLLRKLDFDTDAYIDNLSDSYMQSTIDFELSVDSLLKNNSRKISEQKLNTDDFQ